MKGEYVKVLYLDVSLDPHTVWNYGGTPNNQTLFLYLIEGTLAADENLTGLENKACAMLMAPSSAREEDFDNVMVKAGQQGARFFLLAAEPLKEPVAWGGPIVMNTREELDEAFRDLDNNTFIRHTRPHSF